MMRISRLFHGGSLRRRLCCLLLGLSVFCFPVSYVAAHGGGSGSGGSGGSGSSSGSSGSSGSGGSGGHGGPGGSMGGGSAGPGGFSGNGSGSSASGHGGTGHGGSGLGPGHASSQTSAHGTAVSHNAAMTVAKSSASRNQVVRNSFTSDTMLARSPDRIRNHQIFARQTSTGGFTPETDRKKKLKANNVLAAKNATGNNAGH
jgi:hypothetical protein